MKPTIFVHTNEKQLVGAYVSRHSMKRNSKSPDAFDVRIINHSDYPFFGEYEGRAFLRAGGSRTWRNADLQSFTPLRFMPPELMNYSGRAVVVDPDVFAVGDVFELLQRDMGGKAVLAKPRPGHNGRADYMASSVMLLECAKLTHWNCRENFDELFTFKRDYENWITLACEPTGTVGPLEAEWNDFDRLTEQTKLLHNTKRRTQPWKTGLPIDFTIRVPGSSLLPRSWTRGRLFAGFTPPGQYRKHPDPRQEALFFGLLRECVEAGDVSEDMVRDAMAANHVRHDAFDVMDRAPTLN